MTDAPSRSVYTPAMLAEAWCCSERHIRNLVAAGELRAFRLGGKLLRIPQDAVQEFIACQNTASDGSTDGSYGPPVGREARTNRTCTSH